MAQQQPFDAGVLQQALLQVAEATQSAAAAAKAASVVTASGLGQAASANRSVVDWSKLVSKPLFLTTPTRSRIRDTIAIGCGSSANIFCALTRSLKESSNRSLKSQLRSWIWIVRLLMSESDQQSCMDFWLDW